VTVQAAVDAFLDHQDLARSTRRVYWASLASLVAELGPATAVREISGHWLAGWFRDRHSAAAPTTWNQDVLSNLLSANERGHMPPADGPEASQHNYHGPD
jgi:hypothetical protein